MTPAIHPFDLQARAGLAIHGLTGLLDPSRDGLMYFLGDWRSRPPRAHHCLWDCGDGSGRHTDALTLARSMVRKGSPEAQRKQGDQQLENWLLRLLGEEGLSWLPEEPWAAPWGAELLLIDAQPGERCAEVSWAQRGTLMGLLGRYLATREERTREAARNLVGGLLRIAVRHPDGLLLPEGYYRPGGWRTTQAGLFPGIEEVNAAVIIPAIRLYEETGYQPALDLADGLARFALKHTQGYTPGGKIVAPHGGALQEHFHTRSCFIMGVLKLGLVLGRREYVAWAHQGYTLAQEMGTEFGWFPEHLGQRHGEICCTTDMIEIALLLGRHVDESYYADAERYGRNHLLESQFVSLERLESALERLPAHDVPAPFEGRYSTGQDVAGRQVGGFASRPTLNDAFHLDATDLMQCCNAAGTRALYDLWRHAVEEAPAADGQLPCKKVHLRFSVETPALKVVSHEPAAGRLDLTARQDCRVEVRVPEGVPEALAVVGDLASPRVLALPAQNGMVGFACRKDEAVQLHYPLPGRSREYVVGSLGRTVRCGGVWRGETLMQMDPPGIYYPLYERSADLEPVEPGLPAGKMIQSL
jgi:hypothetical protein